MVSERLISHKEWEETALTNDSRLDRLRAMSKDLKEEFQTIPSLDQSLSHAEDRLSDLLSQAIERPVALWAPDLTLRPVFHIEKTKIAVSEEQTLSQRRLSLGLGAALAMTRYLDDHPIPSAQDDPLVTETLLFSVALKGIRSLGNSNSPPDGVTLAEVVINARYDQFLVDQMAEIANRMMPDRSLTVRSLLAYREILFTQAQYEVNFDHLHQKLARLKENDCDDLLLGEFKTDSEDRLCTFYSPKGEEKISLNYQEILMVIACDIYLRAVDAVSGKTESTDKIYRALARRINQSGIYLSNWRDMATVLSLDRDALTMQLWGLTGTLKAVVDTPSGEQVIEVSQAVCPATTQMVDIFLEKNFVPIMALQLQQQFNNEVLVKSMSEIDLAGYLLPEKRDLFEDIIRDGLILPTEYERHHSIAASSPGFFLSGLPVGTFWEKPKITKLPTYQRKEDENPRVKSVGHISHKPHENPSQDIVEFPARQVHNRMIRRPGKPSIGSGPSNLSYGIVRETFRLKKRLLVLERLNKRELLTDKKKAIKSSVVKIKHRVDIDSPKQTRTRFPVIYQTTVKRPEPNLPLKTQSIMPYARSDFEPTIKLDNTTRVRINQTREEMVIGVRLAAVFAAQARGNISHAVAIHQAVTCEQPVFKVDDLRADENTLTQSENNTSVFRKFPFKKTFSAVSQSSINYNFSSSGHKNSVQSNSLGIQRQTSNYLLEASLEASDSRIFPSQDPVLARYYVASILSDQARRKYGNRQR